jgi:hypothetical protein
MSSLDPQRTRKPATAARMYDYYLDGFHNFLADQQAAQAVAAQLPRIPAVAQANRAFLTRAVRFLVDAGIGQFLDIGAGLPAHSSAHHIRTTALDARAVFVDIDPVAVADTLELLDDADWAVAIRGDLRTPKAILEHPKVRRLLDPTRPVGVLLTAVLPFVADDSEAYDAVAQLADALPTGSHIAISHGAAETFPPDSDACKTATGIYQQYTTTSPIARDHTSVQRFFTGLQVLAPGLVCARQWHPEPPGSAPTTLTDSATHSGLWVGIGLKTQASAIGLRL